MKKILIVAEHDHQSLKQATHHTVSAAAQLEGEMDVILFGSDCKNAAEQALHLPGIKRVLLADNEAFAHQLAENSALLIAEMGKDYDYILTGATTFGKNILPRVAALLDVSVVSDVTKIITPDTFERPTYAGNAMATVKLLDAVRILTIRTTVFQAVKETSQPSATLSELSQVFTNTTSRFQDQTLTQSKRPELTAARVIVSGGRGLKSAENFHMLETIADRLGAAVGASRAAVDAGFAPNDYQVGQTGKVVAPDLYIAVGISGAIQHLAGMKDSKVIVAINNDPEAPIFQVADYGLVGDLFKILPELQNELDKVMP